MADEIMQQQPIVESQPAPTPKYGVMIGAGIVLVVLILGGLFLWGKSVTPPQALNVEDAAPSFEVMTSHVDEPNIEFDELPPIPDEAPVIEGLEENTFE
jgi:hypothetical protein